MENGATIFLALVLLISGAGAYRNKENIVADKNRHDEEKEHMMPSARTRGFCASPRCDGYTDADLSSDKQLKFRFPDKDVDADPMSRAEVAAVMGYEGYSHGLLKECEPVTNIFSYSRDWAMHMQTNMRDDIWPNNPGDAKYSCAERCKLEVFNEKREQLNKGSEPNVWVQREGSSGDFFSKIASFGWSPDTCTVGNALQAHWWKEHLETTKENDIMTLMVDPEGLPVFPALTSGDPLSFLLQEEFTRKFCELTPEQKVSVTKRVTKHRPNRARYGKYYNQAMISLKARNYFPKSFPRQCWNDGWNASTAEGVSKD